MRNFILEYSSMEQPDILPNESKDFLMVLQGHRGYKSTICHYTNSNKYRIFPSIVIADLSEEQNRLNGGSFNDFKPKPFYTLDGYIDLNKFKMIPISPYEKNDLIIPDKKYIINRGGTKYDIQYQMMVIFQIKTLNHFYLTYRGKMHKVYLKRLKKKKKDLK